MGRAMTDFRTVEDLKSRMLVPREPEDFLQWGELALTRRTLRGSKDFIFVHLPDIPSRDSLPARIMFKVQGFVHAVDLRPYGNWKG